MSKDKVSILLVDDHRLLISGLTLLLNGEKDFHVVGQADNADAALSLAEALQPEIIVLDISLGNISGLDILPELLKVAPESKIVILTMHNDCRYLQEAMAKGAKAFVVKKAIDEDL
ncbi:MAG: response regulator transcription factor, partial [Deltaproteobacteria bacterium]|nr:response regulator transcription factor [Deltaproteobacteria bacterium]